MERVEERHLFGSSGKREDLCANFIQAGAIPDLGVESIANSIRKFGVSDAEIAKYLLHDERGMNRDRMCARAWG